MYIYYAEDLTEAYDFQNLLKCMNKCRYSMPINTNRFVLCLCHKHL